MSFENFFLRPEDEMDFLPIIPLNESDQEDSNGIDVPAEIALLPLQFQYCEVFENPFFYFMHTVMIGIQRFFRLFQIIMILCIFQRKLRSY